MSSVESRNHGVVFFLRFNALILFLVQFMLEVRSPAGYELLLRSGLPFSSEVPFVNWLPLAWVFSPWFYGPAFAALAAGCFGIFFFPRERAGYVLAFAGLFLKVFFLSVGAGVHLTTIYLILFLVVALRPPRPGDEERTLSALWGVIGLMYFYSAVNKLSAAFLGGDVMRLEWPSLVRWPLLDLYRSEAVRLLTAWAGVLLQFGGALIVLPRFRRWGLASAVVFHVSTSFFILWTGAMALFAITLLFLARPAESPRTYWRAGIFGLGGFAAVMAVLPALRWTGSRDLVVWAFDLASWAWLAAVTVMLLRALFRGPVAPVRCSRLGLAVPTVYFFAGLLLGWPEPLGYTQYAPRRLVYEGYVFRPPPVAYERFSTEIAGRWALRIVGAGEGRFLVGLPAGGVAGQIRDFFCERYPATTYRAFRTRPVFFFGPRILNDARYAGLVEHYDEKETPCASP